VESTGGLLLSGGGSGGGPQGGHHRPSYSINGILGISNPNAGPPPDPILVKRKREGKFKIVTNDRR